MLWSMCLAYDLCVSAGTTQWIERRTRDWKVEGLNPCRSGGRISFSRVNFLCWLLFWYPFHPRVTTVARKKMPVILPNVQVTGYSSTRMHLTYVGLHEVTWCRVVWCTQNAPRWQQFLVAPAMPALYVHHFGGYSKTRYKKLFTHVESHASAVSLLGSGE